MNRMALVFIVRLATAIPDLTRAQQISADRTKGV